MAFSSDLQLHLIDSVDDAFALMRWLGERNDEDDLGPRIGYDTETTGLSPEQDRVRLVQVGDAHVGWAIPFERWGGVVEDIVKKWDGQYVMHNAVYDVAMTRREGIKIPTHMVHDTRLMGHVLEPDASTALKNQASRYVDKRAASLQRALDEALSSRGKWTWATVPIVAEGPMAVYWQYGALDPVMTYQLDQHHRPLVMAEAPQAYGLELAVGWVIEKMERNGAAIDREFTQEKFDEFGEYVESVEKWCVDTYGVKPGQNASVIEILTSYGYEFDKKTESGALSLDKEVLGGIEHPLAQAVLQRRQAQKLRSTYLRRFLEHSEYDGLLHPHINSIGGSKKTAGEAGGEFGVRTARMSMDTPNLQNLPRRGTNPLAEVIRSCIVPRDRDSILLMSDFDQIEMRLLAYLAQEQAMIDIFRNPSVDFFTSMAQQIFNDPELIKGDPRRQITKNSGYAKIYGAGVDKFAATAGITPDEAYAFLHTFDTLYPGVTRFQNKVEQLAHERRMQEGNAYVRSPLTQRRHIAKPGKEYTLVNYLIQGMAAEVLKMKLLELDAAGLKEMMILPVHDEVIFDVPRTEVDEVVHTINGVMNDDQLLPVPITSGIATGESWGTKKELV